MTKPLIAITVDAEPDPSDARSRGKLCLNWNYAEQVAIAGGNPILIPPMADMEAVAQIVHGWLIPGGNDIDARHFGEENHPKVELIAPQRFLGEKSLYEAAPKDLPIFGICYGCQFLNVMHGGSLIQHLPDKVDTVHTGGVMQEVALEPDTKLSSITQVPSVTGRSYHHQAIARVGEGLKVNAYHPDGTIEGVESVQRPWMVGVQWHPERTEDDAPTQRLFREFVERARLYMESKKG